MKKLFVILLVLAMLIPMGVTTQAAQVERKPFYLISKTDYSEDYEYVIAGFPELSPGDFASDSDALNLSVSDERLSQIKQQFDSYPDGTRFMITLTMKVAFQQKNQDNIYMEKPVEICKAWLDGVLTRYKALGGKLDGILVDTQYQGAFSDAISEAYSKNKEIFNNIVSNPNYQTKVRPKLVERGFAFYQDDTGAKSEIYCVYSNSGDEYVQSREIWDAVMNELLMDYIDEAMVPLYHHYPNAVCAEYDKRNTYAWDKELSAYAVPLGAGGNATGAGTHGNLEIYNDKPSNDVFNRKTSGVYPNISGYNKAVFEQSAFKSLVWCVNEAKTVARASDNGKWNAYLTHYMYKGTSKNYLSNSPYFSELYYHVALANPHQIFGHYIPDEVQSAGGNYDNVLHVANDLMSGLTRYVGYTDRTVAPTAIDWNSDYLLSGMYANGKIVWRITPNTDVVALSEFKVSGKDPTFSVNGKTITFPGGKILKESSVCEIGTCGYWIETARNVKPVITQVDNYYREYPSFGEDFESYKPGLLFDSETATPKAVWETQFFGNTYAAVVNNSGDRQLSVSGTYTMTNVILPQNITAGDDYAKHQAWEVEVTLPKNLPANAELVLLNCVGQDAQASDVGVKIAGGKLYYNNAGVYQEMANVNLPAGIYRVVREVDFSNEAALTSDYAVYDSDGKLLGQATDIPMSAIGLPVTAISLGCANVTKTPILLDDYKLYPTQRTFGFELYDAKSGLELTDLNMPRAADTAYRAAWMNATNEEKYYAVTAVYYNEDTVVKEEVVDVLRMLPYTEGVNTGVAGLGNNGQKVLVCLKETGKPADAPMVFPEGDTLFVNPDQESYYVFEQDEITDSTEQTESTENTEQTESTDNTEQTESTDNTVHTEVSESTGTLNNEPTDTNPGGIGIALIMVGGILALTCGGFLLCWFVIKPEWLMNLDLSKIKAFFEKLK